VKLAKLVLTLGFVVSVSATFQAQTGNATGGNISGRVTQHGRGLPDILVKATRELSVRPDSPGIEARTDSQGYYRIGPVVAGQYFVTVYGPGLVPLRNDQISGSPRQISVSAGETVTGVDFDLIVGGTITGSVTNSAGKPIAQQAVMLTSVSTQPNPTLYVMNPALIRFTSGYFRTDDLGFYRIDGIPPGSYIVSVGPHFTAFMTFSGRIAYRQTFFPSTPDRANARPIEIAEAANISNIDIKIGEPVATFSASGRVVDGSTGAPIPGVTFDLQIEESGERGTIPKAGTSNPDGEFKLESLPAGHYSIKVSEDRGQAGGDFFGTSSWFDIRDSDVHSIELRVEKTLMVFGTVVIANTNEPAVLAKASQLDLYFEVSPNDRGPIAGKRVRPTSNLTFAVYGLKPGRMRVHLNSDKQIAELGLRFLRMELGTNPIREFEIGHDKQTQELRVILVYGSGSLRGSVKLENGSLPANARLAANVKDDKGFFAGTWVDTNGNFLLNALPAGTYNLTVTAEEPGKRTLGPEAHQAVSISENKASTAVITLDLSGLKAP
jgi:hypothetical protein